MKTDVGSLPVYEILTLFLEREPESFFRSMVDRFARVCGAVRIVLHLRIGGEEALHYWGFRSLPDPEKLVERSDANTYYTSFDDGELGFIYVEHSHFLSEQDKVLYSMVMPAIERSIKLKKAQMELARSRRREHQIFETAFEAFTFVDEDFKFREVSSHVERMLGYSYSEMIGKPLLEIFYEEDRPMVSEEIDRRRKGHKGVYEARFLHKEGYPVWVQVSASPVYDEKGKFKGTLGILTDIDEKKKIEVEATRQKVFFENLFRMVPEALVVVDKEHRIVDINEAFTELFEFEPAEVLGLDLDDVLEKGKKGSADRKKTCEIMRGEEVEFEAVRYSKTGRPIYVLAKASPIYAGDEMAGAVVMYADITKHKEYETYLKKKTFKDPLTKLYNRTYFEETMKRVQYDEKAFPVALLIMDMDNLKEVNDTLGHAKGDEYLETCGYLLDKCVRKQDVLARIGGDEFAVILKSSGKDTAERLARRIKRAFDEENERKAYKIPLSISIGYAGAESPEQDLEEIFDLADVAMYRQKASKSASGH